MSKALFLLGCIPVRLLLAYICYKMSPANLTHFSIILFMIGFSFVYLYLMNKRLDAPEASGETWWHNIRPIHGFFYLTASVYAFKGDNIASLFLLFDVIFGFSAYLYKQNH